MVRIITAFLVTAAFGYATEVTMTDAERAKALTLMTDSETEFLGSVRGLSDAQWNFKAAPEKWSIAQTAEHIMLSESLIFSAVTGTMKAPVDPDWEAKTGSKVALLESELPDRSTKVKAPEMLQPQSKLTRDQIIEGYRAARQKTIAFTKSTRLPLKEHVSPHPFFGPLNGYEWLIAVPLHNHRHNLQIAEVKASPGYPAN